MLPIYPAPFRPIVAVSMILFIVFLYGCSPMVLSPRLSLTEEESRALFADTGSIAVISSQHVPEFRLTVPAKGLSDGGTKGVREGAAFGLELAQSPGSPEAKVVSLMLTPLFAGVGGVYGMFAASSSSFVDDHEAAVRKAVAEMRIQEKMNDAFWKNVYRITSRTFVPLETNDPFALGIPDYQPFKAIGIDPVLELTVTEFGLLSSDAVQPILTLYVTLRTRLVRAHDNAELIMHDFTCTGTGGWGHYFTAWAENDARLFMVELDDCYQRLAVEVLARLYLVDDEVSRNDLYFRGGLTSSAPLSIIHSLSDVSSSDDRQM